MTTPGEKKDKTHVVYKPVTSLKEKAGSEKGSGFGFDLAMITKAEKALNELSGNFSDWMNQEMDRLSKMRNNALQSGLSDAAVDALFRSSHDLKGQAATLGFPLVGAFCDSLCKLLDGFADKSRIPELLINQHVDAARAVVKANIKEEQHEKASLALTRLRNVTAECIKNEKEKTQGGIPQEEDDNFLF